MTDDPSLRTYIVTFNAQEADIPAFVAYIQTSRFIRSYWNYLPLIYCVKTHLFSDQLMTEIAPFFSNGHFMVAEINLRNINGALPKAAWEWFYNDPPASALGGLQKLGESALSGFAPPPDPHVKSALSGFESPDDLGTRLFGLDPEPTEEQRKARLRSMLSDALKKGKKP